MCVTSAGDSETDLRGRREAREACDAREKWWLLGGPCLQVQGPCRAAGRCTGRRVGESREAPPSRTRNAEEKQEGRQLSLQARAGQGTRFTKNIASQNGLETWRLLLARCSPNAPSEERSREILR